MTIKKLILFLSVFSSVIILINCNGDSSSPDTSDINVNWNFIPFHLDQKPSEEMNTYVNSLTSTYPDFTKLFFTSVLPIYNENKEIQEGLISDPGLLKLIDTTRLVFQNIEEIEQEFDVAFKNYVFYTNDFNVPNVYTFVSGFAYQTFIFSDGDMDGLGIGLDMFLGSGFPYKEIDKSNPSFSAYLTQYFDKKYLIRKSLLTWLDDKIAVTKSAELLDIIIRNGKILYILEKILPNASKEVILEFQHSEYFWCLENEAALWSHLLQGDLLYEDNFSKINKLVNPSPGAPGIPKEAPGGVANYIGWRIVQDYMSRTNNSFVELITEKDPQRILNISKYRPRERKF